MRCDIDHAHPPCKAYGSSIKRCRSISGNAGRENCDESLTIRQIYQSFPPPKFCAIRYQNFLLQKNIYKLNNLRIYTIHVCITCTLDNLRDTRTTHTCTQCNNTYMWYCVGTIIPVTLYAVVFKIKYYTHLIV